MLEPRETDILALLVVFVVLPLVAYVLLGKWSESTKKKERISLLAQQAAEEEALRVEAMTAASVIRILPAINSSTHQCARCFGQTTTRCKRCKSVWYCSGKCQIIHWREVHKHECQQLVNNCGSVSPKLAFGDDVRGRVLFGGKTDSESIGDNFKQPIVAETPLESESHSPRSSLHLAATAGTKVETSLTPLLERKSTFKRLSNKSDRGSLNRVDEPLSECFDQEFINGVSCSTRSCNTPVKDPSFGENNSSRNPKMPTSQVA